MVMYEDRSCNPAMYNSMVTQEFLLHENVELFASSNSTKVSLGQIGCLTWGLRRYQGCSEKINDGISIDSPCLVYCFYIADGIVRVPTVREKHRYRVLYKQPTVETRIKLP